MIHSGGIQLINTAPDGESLFTTDYEGCLRKWDIRRQELVNEFGCLQIFSRYSKNYHYFDE